MSSEVTQNNPRLRTEYQEVVVKKLMDQFKYSSSMELPQVTKITLNMGVGEAVADKKVIEHAVKGMLPRNRLGRAMIKKLKIHSGAEHPYQAQQPKPLV